MLRRCEMWILYKIGQLLVVLALLCTILILVVRTLMRSLDERVNKRPRPP